MYELYSKMMECGEMLHGLLIADPILYVDTAEHIREALSILPVPKLRVCVDIDNTLVTSPTTKWDYSTVEPIHEMIHNVQLWKAQGHTIILHTARRTETHKNNVGAAIADCARVTLERFQIPYDELLFGKPIADVYVDDKAYNPYLSHLDVFGLK